MKYTKEKYYAEHAKLTDVIKSLQEKKSVIELHYRMLLHQDSEYGKVLLRINELRAEKQQLTNEHYSDFRVYTTGERSRDSRLDCMVVRE